MLLRRLLHGELTEDQAAQMARLGPEALTLALIAANARLAQLQGHSPATPSGMVPAYQKPSRPRRRKRPGATDGHAGARRRTPVAIDARVARAAGRRWRSTPASRAPPGEVPRPQRPAATLQRCNRSRTRTVEDVPEQIAPVVTEHTVHRDYCPACRRHVEPVVPDAMPNATLGHHVVAPVQLVPLRAGRVTVGQVRDILGSHLHAAVTAGGLLDGWQRLAAALDPWYQQVADATPGPARCCTPTRPAGGSTAGRTGSGASPTGAAAIT